MKRQRENIANQSAVKKPDVNVSTDFRSKIGAKLQTLLNGFTPERRFHRNRRHLYEDLFGEPQHSPIIIDPTIVIKTETPDTDDSSNDTSSFNSQNFLLSAKSRINELLNKQQSSVNKYPFKDNEKENSASNNECASSSSIKSNSYTETKSLLSNTLSKRRKISSSREDSSEPTINQVRLKQLVVVVEDIMKSKNRTKFSHLLPADPESENFSVILSASTDDMISVHSKSKASDSFVLSDQVECILDESSSVINKLDPHLSISECNSTENNHLHPSTSKSSKVTKSSVSASSNSSSVSAVIPFGDFLLEENIDPIPAINIDDSELVDDPPVCHEVLDDECHSLVNKNSVNQDEVVLLCVKKPTHEVITLEDDDNSDDVIEEVHECVQCGKAFRAKSLLNFHIRMHGSDSSSQFSTSQSCSA